LIRVKLMQLWATATKLRIFLLLCLLVRYSLFVSRQRCFDRQDAVSRQGRLDHFRLDSLWQQEFPIVLPVHGAVVAFLLVLGVNLKTIVDGLNDDLLRRVLSHVEAQLQHFAVAGVVDERRVEAVQPRAEFAAMGTVAGRRMNATSAARTAVSMRWLTCRRNRSHDPAAGCGSDSFPPPFSSFRPRIVHELIRSPSR